MMKNKSIRIFTIAMALMIILSTFSVVFGVGAVLDDKIGGITEGNVADAAALGVNTILGVVQIIGAGIAVIMLIVLAIKYVSAAPNEKAEIKKHAIVYVVGAICMFGAVGILGIVRSFTTDAFGEG